jgi:hypothetical protein
MSNAGVDVERTSFDECVQRYLRQDPKWIARNAALVRPFIVAKVGTSDASHLTRGRGFLLSRLLCRERGFVDEETIVMSGMSSLRLSPTNTSMMSESFGRKRPKIRAPRHHSRNADYSLS